MKRQKMKPDTTSHTPLLTVREAAARFKVSQNFLYRHLRELPHMKLGSSVRFIEHELMIFWKRKSL